MKNRAQRRALKSIERRMAKQVARVERIGRRTGEPPEDAIVKLNRLWASAVDQKLVDERH